MRLLRFIAPRALPVVCVLLAACAEPPPLEKRVHDFIAHAETLAENREYTELVGLLAGDYLDSRGNDKLKTAGILRAFYLRNKSVHLFVRVDEITSRQPDYATVTLYVAMARRPFTAAEAANLPVANMHRVVLDLAADGESFEILQTDWQRANAANVLF